MIGLHKLNFISLRCNKQLFMCISRIFNYDLFGYYNCGNMKLKRIPEVYRNVQDSSITLSYGKPKNSLIWLHGLCDTS